MLRQMKQFFSLTATLGVILSLTSTVHADCFNGSGKAGMIRNLDRPWVFTVYVPDKAGTEGHYRVKSFGVNLTGKLDCKGSKTFCQSDRGGVSLKKTDRGIEMKFSSDLAVEKRNNDEEAAVAESKPELPPQLFVLDKTHSDVCYDAFFKTSDYKDYANAHGNQVTFPLEKPVATPSVPRSAAIEE